MCERDLRCLGCSNDYCREHVEVDVTIFGGCRRSRCSSGCFRNLSFGIRPGITSMFQLGTARRRGYGAIARATSGRQCRGHWASFLIASALIRVKKLTELPSGSRNKSERFPHGIVVGA